MATKVTWAQVESHPEGTTLFSFVDGLKPPSQSSPKLGSFVADSRPGTPGEEQGFIACCPWGSTYDMIGKRKGRGGVFRGTGGRITSAILSCREPLHERSFFPELMKC